MSHDPPLPEPSDAEDRSTGETLDRVRWDYDPTQHHLSPLVSSERYFRDFPWDGAPEATIVDPEPAPVPRRRDHQPPRRPNTKMPA